MKAMFQPDKSIDLSASKHHSMSRNIAYNDKKR